MRNLYFLVLGVRGSRSPRKFTKKSHSKRFGTRWATFTGSLFLGHHFWNVRPGGTGRQFHESVPLPCLDIAAGPAFLEIMENLRTCLQKENLQGRQGGSCRPILSFHLPYILCCNLYWCIWGYHPWSKIAP